MNLKQRPWKRAWFAVAPKERWLLAAVVAVWLLGLLARREHLRRESVMFYDPAAQREASRPGSVPEERR